MSEDKHAIVPKWLEELQQKSWEPEILLSGIVLYGMFKVPELLDDFLAFFKLNIFGNSQDIDNLVALFKMGIYWLIGGLILHLVCRGIWIGMVGLSYTFPQGIQMSRLKYKGKFRDKVEGIPSYKHIVIRLEKVCSSLFSVSFMLFMSLIGGYLYFLVLVIIPFTVAYLVFDIGFTGQVFDAFQIYVLFVVCIGLIALLDFVSLGYLRGFKWFSRFYWPLHQFISALTLSRFYRPIYYGVVTNFNKWTFFVFLVLFTVISIFGAGSISNKLYPGDSYSQLELWDNGQGYVAFSGNYDDQNQAFPSVRAHIPSDVISGDVLKLFVVAHITYEENMLERTPLDSLRKVYPDTSDVALKLMVIDSYLTVSIDDQEVEVNRWFFHYKQHTNQRGYLTYLNIGELEEGPHELKVSLPNSFNLSIIPFYKDLTFNPSNNRVDGNKPEQEREDFQPKPFGIRE